MSQQTLPELTTDPTAADKVLDEVGIHVPPPPEVIIDLPAGFISPDGRVLRQAEVRELTGEDEEALARGGVSSSLVRYLDTIIQRCLIRIDDEKPDFAMMKGLLVGDRNAILLGIRRATYGDDIEMTLTCPKCKEEFEVAIELDKDVKFRTMDDPLKRTFQVPLRRGRVATIRFLNGADQEAAIGDGKRTLPEQNTIILSRVVSNIDGQPIIGEDAIRKLGAADRSTLMEFLAMNQPGPLLGEVSVPCSHCGESSPLSLSMEDLFR